MSDFDLALKLILDLEGGYVNDPLDSGGATNFGIVQRTYDDYRKNLGLQTQPVKLIAENEVREIYAIIWQKAFGDEIPSPLNIAVFDFVVNEGNRAIKILQSLLDIPADGIYGEQTANALNGIQDVYTFTGLYLDAQDEFYDRLVKVSPSKQKFLAGWHNRVSKTRNFLAQNLIQTTQPL